jgi:hypothetical protein
MSHHLDSPLAREDTRLDITDVYLFRGTAGTVFVMNVNPSVAGRNYPERFAPRRCTSSRWTPMGTLWKT